MLSKPLKAKDIQIEVFWSGADYPEGITFKDEANKWLRDSQDDVIVHDIVFHHNISADANHGVASIMIVWGFA